VLHAGSDGAPGGGATDGGGYDDKTVILPRPVPDDGSGGQS
jgi:hypothetical protein